MKKKMITLLLAMTMTVQIGACSTAVQPAEEKQEQGETTDQSTTDQGETADQNGAEDQSEFTTDDALALIEATLGTEDAETGNTYSFGYIDTCTIDGVEYYAFMWSWLVNNDHMSVLTQLFVTTDGTAIYEGQYLGEESTLYSDENILGE